MARKANGEPEYVPPAPRPSSDTPADGIDTARAEARRYLVDCVRLWAAVAFSPDSEASLFTKCGAAKDLAAIAGVPTPSTPELPPPSQERSHDGRA